MIITQRRRARSVLASVVRVSLCNHRRGLSNEDASALLLYFSVELRSKGNDLRYSYHLRRLQRRRLTLARRFACRIRAVRRQAFSSIRNVQVLLRYLVCVELRRLNSALLRNVLRSFLRDLLAPL